MSQTNSIALHTLGCKLNFTETATISRQLLQAGFTIKEFQESADFYVINTCSVTENADKECASIINKIKKNNVDAKIIITGCYAQLKPHEIAQIPGVDLVLGAAEKFNLVHHLSSLSQQTQPQVFCQPIGEYNYFEPSFSINERTRVFLKVQDGCNYNCSFCTIPLARGQSRSNLKENILNQIKTLEQQNVQEIVLTGINLGDYGATFDKASTVNPFLDLLQTIENSSSIPRFRLSSIEPNLISDELIHFIAESKKFQPHFHIPLQSGSDRILKLMQRRYTTEKYFDKISKINNLMPHCGIGIDVIVGFPSESSQDFENTYQFLHHLPLSYLHVFTYSERTQTKALEIKPIVPIHIRKERNQILRNLSLKKHHSFKEKFLHTTRPVLFESINKKGKISGYTDNYIRIETESNKEWENKIVDWVITSDVITQPASF